MKKEYEAPDIYIEEFELENIAGNLCSGISPIPSIYLKDIHGKIKIE